MVKRKKQVVFGLCIIVAVIFITLSIIYFMEPLNNLKNQTNEKSNLIEDNPYIKILSPQAHEVWTEGDIREIRWNSFNINKVRIALAIGGHDKGHLGDERNDFIIDAKQEKYTWKIPPGFVTDFGIIRSDEVQISFFDASNDQALERCNFTIQGTNSKN
ncbi:MAG: hypothetical protein Q8N86_00745 [Atribacterota bacterium]|nr:hypothetical protein [Atribacterota bacterium]